VESTNLEEEVVEELFKFIRHVIYGDEKSSTMAEARTAKWKVVKKMFICLPPDANSLHQHCLCANCFAYLVCHFSMRHLPSPLGHEAVVATLSATHPALPTHLPELERVKEVRVKMMDREGRRIHQNLTILIINEV